MHRNSLSNLHDQIDSFRSTSLPQVKNFFQKQLTKCINECRLQTINLKRSIGNHTSSSSSIKNRTTHDNVDTEDEFVWGSDFDDFDEEIEGDLDRKLPQNSSNDLQSFDLNHNNHSLRKTKCPKRPSNEPPPPPLPKCPPPDFLQENLILQSPLFHTSNSFERINDDDYLVPNTSAHSQSTILEAIERPLPPIPKDDHNENDEEYEQLRKFAWFHDIERDQSEKLLLQTRTTGAFLVRKSRRAGFRNPYTLTLLHNNRVFHLNIRKRLDQLFALGTEKPREKTFNTIADLIEFHSVEPIYLTLKGLIVGVTVLVSSKLAR
ncbi:Putative ATP-dependent RNA helicase DDX11-like protein [Sarcoptes scabiei]|nr:Putative ATP-dependent RNA helicase DDX11-like protein [Sarcoptes scabiei]